MSDSDFVRIRGMRFWGKHGADPGERDRAQPIDLDVELAVDTTAAAASDDVADAVDYCQIHGKVERIVTQRCFALLETMAEACLMAILEDRRVRSATVWVRKPRLLDGATPEVQMTRHQPD